jgi:AcrR family transcriptional regulator
MTQALAKPDTRTAILEAAERAFATHGYKKVTVEDIAAGAGLGRRTIYLHFQGKKHIALAVIDRIVEQLFAELARVAASAVPPSERLRRMLVCRVLFLFDRERDLRHTLDDMYKALMPRYKTHREKYIRGEVELFAGVLREGEERGEFSDLDAAEVAGALVMATNSLTPFSLNARQRGQRTRVERQVRLIADLLVDGLLSKRP